MSELQSKKFDEPDEAVSAADAGGHELKGVDGKRRVYLLDTDEE